MIVSVRYGRTFNTGNYESLRLDCDVEVEPGQTPEQAMEQAKQFVLGIYEAQQQRQIVENDLAELSYNYNNLKARVQSLHNRHKLIAERYTKQRELLINVGADSSQLPEVARSGFAPYDEDTINRWVTATKPEEFDPAGEYDSDDEGDDEVYGQTHSGD